MRFLLVLAILVSGSLAAATQGQNNNLGKAKGTVDNIRQADPPQVSTGTVVTPQAPVHQMPRGGSDVTRMRTNPPPPPATTKKTP